MAQFADISSIHTFKRYASLFGNTSGQVNLVCMLLPILKRKGIDFLKMFFGPEEAGGGILSATKHDQSLIVIDVTSHNGANIRFSYNLNTL